MAILRLATYNANSIRARLPIIMDWLIKKDPDILCLQETKVRDKDFPVAAFQEGGYISTFRGQKAYNGVAILSKATPVEIRFGLYGEDDEQARFIGATIQDIPIISVYAPQGSQVGTSKFDYKLRWLRELLAYVRKHYEPGSPLILAGDFNVAMESIDLFDPEKYEGDVGFHPEERAILRQYFDWGLIDLFRKHESGGNHYTFWDYRIPNGFKRNLGWRIDYILATKPLAAKSRSLWIDTEARGREKPSDHTFLVAEFALS